MHHLLYLHGFNSSPQSVKARQTQAWLAARGLGERFDCPALPFSPAAAALVVEEYIERLGAADVTLVGSSLGGFYATWASARFGCAALLINPAVQPYRLLAPYLGPQRNMYSGVSYVLEPRHMHELQALEPARIDPTRFWLLLETGDETLDYRDAVRYYAGGRQRVVGGGDHSLQCWDELLPEAMGWAGVS